jgi:hypothetical protein
LRTEWSQRDPIRIPDAEEQSSSPTASEHLTSQQKISQYEDGTLIKPTAETTAANSDRDVKYGKLAARRKFIRKEALDQYNVRDQDKIAYVELRMFKFTHDPKVHKNGNDTKALGDPKKFLKLYKEARGEKVKSIEEGISGIFIDYLERRTGAGNVNNGDERSKAVVNIRSILKKFQMIDEYYMAHQQFVDAVGEFKRPATPEPIETSRRMRGGLHVHEVKNNLLKYSAGLKDSLQVNPTFQRVKVRKPVEKAPVYDEFTLKFIDRVQAIHELEDKLEYLIAYRDWDGISESIML